MADGNRRMYLPGLLGLRFLAAFSVYFGHLQQAIGWAHLPLIPVRYSGSMPDDGVTLFFVLSGFLITYLLLTEQAQTGAVDIRRFYTRRVLRIWPLYYAFTAFNFFVLPQFAALNYTPELDIAITGHFWERLALYLFLSPHVCVTLFTHPGVAGPLWSVGSEEYFYAFWPQLVARLKRHLPLGLALVAAVPTAARAFGSPSVAMFFFYFRIDCMAFGAFAAWAAVQRPQWLSYVCNAPVQAVAYALAAVHLVRFQHYGVLDDLVYSSTFAVIIVNVALNPKTFFTLENRFFRFMGEISYGFYVFQWLVNLIVMKTYLTYFSVGNDYVRGAVLLVTTFALTTGLAAASYYFWEKRFLKLKERYAVIKSGAPVYQ